MTTLDTMSVQLGPADDDPWKVTDADEILPAGAVQSLWYAARRGGIGGSDVSAMLGMSKYKSPISLWLDKTGRAAPEPHDPDSFAAWGHRLEQAAVDWFVESPGIKVRRAGMYRSRICSVALCNPDRLTEREGLEVKSLEWHTEHEWDNDETPDHAELQAQWCMGVTGRTGWWVIGLVNGRRPHLRYIVRDDALIARLFAEAERWWNAYVVADEMPPLDGSQATEDALARWIGPADPGEVKVVSDELLDLYQQKAAADADVALAKARVTELDSRIRVEVGTASAVVLDPNKPTDDTAAGKRNVLLTVRNDGTFASSRFAAAHPELVEEFTRPATALDTAALREEYPAEYAAFRARQIRPRRKALDAALAARAATAADTTTPTTDDTSRST